MLTVRRVFVCLVVSDWSPVPYSKGSHWTTWPNRNTADDCSWLTNVIQYPVNIWKQCNIMESRLVSYFSMKYSLVDPPGAPTPNGHGPVNCLYPKRWIFSIYFKIILGRIIMGIVLKHDKKWPRPPLRSNPGSAPDINYILFTSISDWISHSKHFGVFLF